MSALAGFHLHLYQPPRESPWLGTVEGEWSAWPYHDWNERVAAECYRAFVSVALPVEGGGVELVEPLAASSIDVGPTLHHWFAAQARDVERALIHEAGTHGPASRVALAAPLVHAILPLATPTDAARLVAWGIADYRARHGVDPAGFWLPETAVDLATLEVLAGHGISYTVLMPGQAARVRVGDGEWTEVTDETLDTSRAYSVALASGRPMTVVFGHRDLSRGVAFGELLGDGEALADAMAAAAGADGVALVVADAETYGHHHRFGELGLAWAQRTLEDRGTITTLGEWLAGHAPTAEVELHPVSSWSCAHGVERWRSACGCVTGEVPGYSLDWRQPLREALDWLRSELGARVEEALGALVASSGATLTEYGTVLSGAVEPAAFAVAHGAANDADAVARVLELCETYRFLLYSFTSCGWFFADPGEIETGIVLRYAARAAELGAAAIGVDLSAELAERLAGVRSQLHRVAGAALVERASAASRITPGQIAAGAAIEARERRADARSTRGAWRVSVERTGDDTFTVEAVDARTTRSYVFVAEVKEPEERQLSVVVHDNGRESAMGLVELGGDVVARVAAARLVDPESRNYEAALNVLATELLTRGASGGDETVLRALAGAPRCVSPDGEAAVRRALQAIAVQGVGTARHRTLSPLARAVGLGALYPQDGDELGHL